MIHDLNFIKMCNWEEVSKIDNLNKITENEGLTNKHQVFVDDDKTAESRKNDHISLALQSQVNSSSLDKRFFYEPMLSAHPKENESKSFDFLGKKLKAPIWISSMTGGTLWAGKINSNLAQVAHDFGFGMGLGSCRSLLTDDTFFQDFNLRPIIGDQLPLYANLGIAQVEKLINLNKLFLIDKLLDKLNADGLIIHINPMQEWLQPEGDLFEDAPLRTIQRLIDKRPELNIIVKEVGQGMGYESLKALMQLPIQAIDFAAAGGTSFALLELLRNEEEMMDNYCPFTTIGNSADEMVEYINQILDDPQINVLCKQVIVSGGIKSFLDGYYLINKINCTAIYGQASSFLQHARGSYDKLANYVDLQLKGFRMAEAYLRIRK